MYYKQVKANFETYGIQQDVLVRSQYVRDTTGRVGQESVFKRYNRTCWSGVSM